MRQLPLVYGYSMDARLREFRRADPDEGLVIVPFDSPEGQELLVAAAAKQEENRRSGS